MTVESFADADSSDCVPGDIDWNDSETRRRLALIGLAADTTTSAIIITDGRGVTAWVNRGFTRVTGYSIDEAVGQTPAQLLQGPETDRCEAGRIGAALRARECVSAELINYTKDGRRFWIGMKIEPLFRSDGELEGFMAIEADITNRRVQQEAIERLTRRFNMATRAARVGVFERDANWNISWWGGAMWDIFGQDPGGLPLTHDAWLELIHPEDRERIHNEVARRAKSASPVNMQYRIIRPDGEVRHLQSIGAPADPEHGVVDRVTGITLDVTERVHAEQREYELQHQLRESSHQAGMAEIATGVLHNVGNILNSLGVANTTAQRELKSLRLDRLERAATLLRSNRDTLATYLTADERGRHLPDYLPALSAQITSSSRAIQAELDTIAQLLVHLSEVVSAQQELARVGGRREAVRLKELVETALLVQVSQFTQIDVVREYEELPSIMTDRHRLLQILVNLVSNARDAVHARGTEHGRILVKLDRDGDHVRVTVEDSGIGMSEEVLSQLWRFGFTTKKNGHGFGLHNSAIAAHDIGATLTAHSDGVGQGSRFVLRLPVEQTDTLLSGAAA